MLNLWPSDLAATLQALPLEPGSVAAFDADETLWHTDAGIGFLEDACMRQLLSDSTKGREVFDAYVETRQKDVGEGLMACATSFSGLPIARVEELAAAYAEAQVIPVIYPAMRQLFDYLHGRGVRVFVVTASFEHAVRAGAAALGVPPERVVGIRLASQDGILGQDRVGEITYRAGKPSELVARAGGLPVLAMGNGSNDLELLEAATGLAVAINPSTSTRSDGSASLAEHAKRNGWPVFRPEDPRK